MIHVYALYTDVSCLERKERSKEIIGLDKDNKVIYAYQEREELTTNNRMEMKAILHTMEFFGKLDNGFAQPIIVYSDSRYCVNTFTDWAFKWRANNWIKSDNKTPENLDLVQKYMEYIDKGYMIDLRYIRGHNGTLGNELADQLATGKILVSEVMEKYGVSS